MLVPVIAYEVCMVVPAVSCSWRIVLLDASSSLLPVVVAIQFYWSWIRFNYGKLYVCVYWPLCIAICMSMSVLHETETPHTIMCSNTLPFLEGHLPPSGTCFQNPAGPKRLQLWFMSHQFPLLCASSLCCYRCFFWGLLILVLLQYQKLGPTILLYKSEDFWTTFRRRYMYSTRKIPLLSLPYFSGKGLSWAGYFWT